MLGSVYICEEGVRPWTEATRLAGSARATLTIVSATKADMVTVLGHVFSVLGGLYEHIFRWHTTARPLVGGAMQLARLQSEMSRNPPGFGGTFLAESSHAGVWCNISQLELPFREFHLDFLCGGRRSLLVLSADYRAKEEVWQLLSKFPLGYESAEIRALLDASKSLIVGRGYDEETHTALQFFGMRESIEVLDAELAALAVS